VISETAHLRLGGGNTLHGFYFLPEGLTIYEKTVGLHMGWVATADTQHKRIQGHAK
jgi:hypothetical protein